MNNHPSTFLYRFPQTIQALSLFVRDFQRQQQRPQKAVSKSMENWGRKPDELFLVFAWCLKKKKRYQKSFGDKRPANSFYYAMLGYYFWVGVPI